MKLYYATDPDAQGRHLIYYAVWDRDVFSFEHTTNIPLSEMEIDEIADNKALCVDLAKRLYKEDAEGDRKYYVDAGGNIVAKDGWEEVVAVSMWSLPLGRRRGYFLTRKVKKPPTHGGPRSLRGYSERAACVQKAVETSRATPSRLGSPGSRGASGPPYMVNSTMPAAGSSG